jgi:hypothetical protein
MTPNNSSIIPFFYIEPVRNGFKSSQEGRDIYEDREHIKILIAGDKHTEVVREVTAEDKERFHEAYSRFKRAASEREQIVGTPLTACTFLSASICKELEFFNVYTVEQAAGLSDTAKQSIGMGANDIVAKCKAFLEASKDQGHVTHLAAENERMKADIARLTEQVKELAALASEKQDDTPRRGRPPKASYEAIA